MSKVWERLTDYEKAKRRPFLAKISIATVPSLGIEFPNLIGRPPFTSTVWLVNRIVLSPYIVWLSDPTYIDTCKISYFVTIWLHPPVHSKQSYLTCRKGGTSLRADTQSSSQGHGNNLRFIYKKNNLLSIDLPIDLQPDIVKPASPADERTKILSST